MTAEDIKNLISTGEGYNTEFKVSVPSKIRELTEEVCAFANSAGGRLLIGVNDKNEIKGAIIDNSKLSAIQNSISEISPKLNCTIESILIDDKKVIVINVPSGKQKPYVFSGSIFVRVGPNTQKLTKAEEMRDFFQQSDKIYFDETPCKKFDSSIHLDKANFSVFRDNAGFHTDIGIEHIINNLQLFTEEAVYKSGAVLFFASSPEFFFQQAIVHCVSFRGIDKRFITDDKSFGGPLYKQYRSSMEWLRGKLNIGYDIEGQGGNQRKEIWEIPETVFKEAIINALSHRDYYEKGAVTTIEVFDNRVEISNPGGLLAAIKPDFGKRSMSRNPLVFGLFQRMNLVEKIGSGIMRMRDLMNTAGLPLPEFSTEGMFTISLIRPGKASEKTKEKTGEKTREKVVEESAEEIIRLMIDNPKITAKEIQNRTGLSKNGVEWNINKLKKEGRIERIGPDKGGYWKVIRDESKI